MMFPSFLSNSLDPPMYSPFTSPHTFESGLSLQLTHSLHVFTLCSDFVLIRLLLTEHPITNFSTQYFPTNQLCPLQRLQYLSHMRSQSAQTLCTSLFSLPLFTTLFPILAFARNLSLPSQRIKAKLFRSGAYSHAPIYPIFYCIDISYAPQVPSPKQGAC